MNKAKVKIVIGVAATENGFQYAAFVWLKKPEEKCYEPVQFNSMKYPDNFVLTSDLNELSDGIYNRVSDLCETYGHKIKVMVKVR